MVTIPTRRMISTRLSGIFAVTLIFIIVSDTFLVTESFTPSLSSRHHANHYVVPTIIQSQKFQRQQQRSNNLLLSLHTSKIRNELVRGTQRLVLFANTNDNNIQSTNTDNERDLILRQLLSSSSVSSNDIVNGNSIMENNNNNSVLRKAVRYLEDQWKERQSEPFKLSRETWNLIFESIVDRTANADENSNNNNVDATATAATSFPIQSQARQEMTEMYRILKDMGQLQLYGAASTAMSQNNVNDANKLLPAGGLYTIPPTLLETILNISMSSLTPQPSNTLLYAGAAFAILEGLISFATGISLNVLVLTTLLIVFTDRLLVNGAVLESFLKVFQPEIQQKVIRHEAGHFLTAYLLGCPVEGIVLSAWGALKDRRFQNRAVSAGTSFFDPELSQQMNTGGPKLTRSSIDRYSIIVMAGIAAEADHYGRADGGAGDEMALVALLSQLSSNRGAGGGWNPDTIRNQARWGATQAVLLLREYKPAYNALVDTLERGGTLGDCIYAIEKAARDYNLLPIERPIGYIIEDRGIVRWSTEAPTTSTLPNGSVVTPTIQQQPRKPFNPDDAEKSLQEYRAEVERKLQDVENRLKELQ